ncbi:MAG: trypsin-like serine protease [Ruminococcaceae bacterium]|nr:trypsin-like serine protease [Oscillospiraceae bacterium]
MDAPPVYAVPYYEEKTPKKEKKAKGGLGGKIVALALCCSLLGGILGAGGMALLGSIGNSAKLEGRKVSNMVEGHREQSIINVAQIDTSKQMTPAEVYAANVNSTVGITTSVTTTNFWGYQTTAAASGSGFIISDDGYIITNHHVIDDAASITVTMYDDTTYEADLVGYDESNDLAVLKIEADGLTPVILGDSDALQVGDSVVAIGNPLGELTFSLTSGTVSALDRTVTMSNNVSMDLIQTDCAINSGNSGGALFNLYGEVVGITNAKYSGSSGSGASIDNIGFAIPLNTVRSIVQSLIENGYISKPYIGLSVSDVSEDAQLYGLPQGAAVRALAEDGPAIKAGLQENDIITAINGETITTGNELVKAVADVAVGEQITLTVFRQNETMEITVAVEERIQQATEGQDSGAVQQVPQSGQQMDPFGGMDPFSYFFGY